jgi:ubiquinone biosynthesis protein
MRILFRLFRLLGVLIRHGAGRLVGLPRGIDGPTRLRILLEDAGGTWIKFGQVLSLQPDVLPRDYCTGLFDLLDRVPPVELSEITRVFREDLGRSPNEVFDEFDPTPLASASIGQVHVARLGGRRLAVKVQRPDAGPSFDADLRIMLALQGIIATLRIARLDWLRRAIGEFVEWTREELDYRTEARFMAALGHNAKDSALEAIPGLVAELSTARVLVAELLEGPVLVDYLRAIEAGRGAVFESETLDRGFDRERFARNIVRNFVSDAFHHGLFHADLHPANLLILEDNVVGYVDFGITGSLSAHNRRALVALTLALSRADLDAIMHHYLRLATVADSSDVAGYRRGLADHFATWFDLGLDRPVLRTSFTRIMLDMLALARRTDLVAGPDTLRYLRSVITAEGLIARFAPSFDVGDYLEVICTNELRDQEWRDWLSPATLAEWAAGGARLLSLAPSAVAERIRSDDGEPDHHRGGGAPDDDRRALQWGLAALVFTVIAVIGGDPTPGVNLFSASLAASAAAATMFVYTVRRTR